MSFLIDPPWLYATGRAYGRLMPEETPAARPWTRRIWEACHAQDGRDWMLNSGVLHLDRRRAGGRTHAISALIFATYPLWLRLGERRARRTARDR
jgi:hypothetical protein